MNEQISKSIEKIDWNQVSIEQGMTPDKVIKAYEDTIKDLNQLNKEFDRFFNKKRKQASHKMFTRNIFDKVQYLVHYNQSNEIDVSRLIKFVSFDDRELFSDICKFIYQFFHEGPQSQRRLNMFRGLLVYYLCRSGF